MNENTGAIVINEDSDWEKGTEIIEPCEHINEIVNNPEEVTRSLESRSPSTPVQQAVGCSTAVVNGLSQQLIDQMNRIIPNCLVSFADLNVAKASQAVFSFLQPPAKEALHSAINERGQTLVVNSAYRTLPQQLMLYNRANQRQCGITAAARPGRSNHHSGLALDIQDYTGWKPFLAKHGWRWFGPNDLPHFDYVGGGTLDIRSTAVLAFQQLWNQHNPNNQIAEDGSFGPNTLTRLNQAPIGGFGVTNSSSATQTGKRILRLAEPPMQGEDVRKVQQSLVKANISVEVDSIFGPASDRAVKQFQQQKGLTVDGVVGPATLLELGL